ncbi:MAG: DUF488 domain-containing protein [Rhodobacteraceae bacterium]|nr:MAG: DUF488 domain-containing protein [Paracoccaceae bacterium]
MNAAPGGGEGPLLATVGYAEATLPEMIARLRAAAVDVVLDVRAVAASRRAGFSKTVLRASLAEADIGYVHLRALGTPKPGREAARKGRIAEMRAIFAEQFATEAAQAQFAEAVAIAAERRAALLCWCADAAKCHRRAVAEALAERLGRPWVDL